MSVSPDRRVVSGLAQGIKSLSDQIVDKKEISIPNLDVRRGINFAFKGLIKLNHVPQTKQLGS